MQPSCSKHRLLVVAAVSVDRTDNNLPGIGVSIAIIKWRV